MKRVAIVGGGISGLATAYYLGRSGIACTLFEERARLGGLIRTEQVGGCLVEAGPDSWLAEKAWMLELIRELGLGDQVVGPGTNSDEFSWCATDGSEPFRRACGCSRRRSLGSWRPRDC